MIVRREIEERTGRNISIGAVYATLERLEAKGYVSSFTGEPTAERGGRAKRLFRVEAAGKRALQISDQTIREHDGWSEGPVEDDMSRCSPPTFACWLLETVVPTPYREALLGDLIEEYTLRTESTSRFTASRWFWSQTCRSVPSMVWSSLRSRDCLISMSIAMGVYIVMEILAYAADLTISKCVAPQPTTYVVLAPIVFLATPQSVVASLREFAVAQRSFSH